MFQFTLKRREIKLFIGFLFDRFPLRICLKMFIKQYRHVALSCVVEDTNKLFAQDSNVFVTRMVKT